MRSISPHLSVLRSVVAIALGCSMVAGSNWTASARTAGAIPAGGLSISSEPAGAAVFVDGRSVGVSPVQLPAVAAGEHRVRIVKDGYLENARIISVLAGQPRAVQVKLTRTPDVSSAGQVLSGGGGGGSEKWLYIAAAGAAAAAAGVLLSNKNHPPSAGTATVSPSGTGIAAVTTFTFTSQGASDQDGNGLTLTWSFGDGGTATGTTVTRTFQNAGTFNVSLTVSDGKAEAKAPDVPVTVRNVNGTWVSNIAGTIRSWTLTQSGTSVSGTYANSAAPGTPGTVSGNLTAQRAFGGTAGLVGFQPFLFEGIFDNSVASLTVVANGSGFDNTTITFTRQ